MNESAGVNVYVVEKHYDYEGAEAVWAGVSFDDAMAYAESLGQLGGDEVTVTRMNPHAVESWSRGRYDIGYSHRVCEDGSWKNVDNHAHP